MRNAFRKLFRNVIRNTRRSAGGLTTHAPRRCPRPRAARACRYPRRREAARPVSDAAGHPGSRPRPGRSTDAGAWRFGGVRTTDDWLFRRPPSGDASPDARMCPQGAGTDKPASPSARHHWAGVRAGAWRCLSLRQTCATTCATAPLRSPRQRPADTQYASTPGATRSGSPSALSGGRLGDPIGGRHSGERRRDRHRTGGPS